MPNKPHLQGSLTRALLPVIASFSLVFYTQLSTAAGLVLASWNIEHLATADGAGCRARVEADYAALRAVAQRLDADIIALQEVETAAAVGRIFDRSMYDIVVSSRPEEGLGDCRGMPGQARTAQRTGFAINRARLREMGLGWRELEPFVEIGVDARRWGTRIWIGPLSARGTADAGQGLELMSLHLKSGCAWGRLETRDLRRIACRILRRQRGILEQWIDGRAGADIPFVLIGDFNRQLDQPNDDSMTTSGAKSTMARSASGSRMIGLAAAACRAVRPRTLMRTCCWRMRACPSRMRAIRAIPMRSTTSSSVVPHPTGWFTAATALWTTTASKSPQTITPSASCCGRLGCWPRRYVEPPGAPQASATSR
jgi:endonuclease/exonuclease/phosphatase family metal-dependent hydrolase